MSAAPGPNDAFLELKAKIRSARGIDCAAYKERCLRRRIAVRMRARGTHTYEAYAGLLDRDPDEYQHLLDTLTINVTRFFRNPEMWQSLTTRYLPELWRGRRGHVRCWSAGCASGEEAYSLAIALAEAARTSELPGWLPRARIDATDIDRVSLEKARRGVYPAAALEEMPEGLQGRYLPGPPPHTVPTEVAGLVQVAAHDMTRQAPLQPPYDVILCRNTVIYFDRATQERLFGVFIDALAVGGLLVLGKVETLFGTSRDRLTLLEPRERIYRRAG